MEIYSSNGRLDSLKGKLVRAVFNKPTRVNFYESSQTGSISESNSANPLPCLPEINGYITGYSNTLSPSNSKETNIRINPWGINNTIIDQEGMQAGDIVINSKLIRSLEEL